MILLKSARVEPLIVLKKKKKDSGNHLFLMNNLTPCCEPFFALCVATILMHTSHFGLTAHTALVKPMPLL